MAEYIVSNGETNSGIILNTNDSMTVLDGGIANITTVNSGGSMSINNGGTANDTTVNQYGNLFVSSGGVADNTVVNTYGRVNVLSGGTANNTTVKRDASLYISSDALAEYTTLDPFGWMHIFSGGTANSTTVTSDGGIRISGGGVANNTMVNSYGWVNVLPGGTANSTTVEGAFYVFAGGTANSTMINSGGWFSVSSGGTATDVTALEKTRFFLAVAPDTYVTGTSGGFAFAIADGMISDFAVNNGELTISYGGTANNIHVCNNGCLYVSAGGTLTGQTTIASGTTVSVFDGAIIDFDISNMVPGAEARINDFSLVSGWKNADFTLTVDKQESGTYVLANGADKFDQTLTVRNTLGETLGTLSIGQTISADDVKYTLKRDGGVLTLDVSTRYNIVSGEVVENGETCRVYNDDIYKNTTVNSGGWFCISSGGIANSTTINSSGDVRVLLGGTLNEVTVNSGGLLDITSGGTANDITVNTGGRIENIDGIANNVYMSSGVEVRVYVNGRANNTTLNSGCLFGVQGEANNITILDGRTVIFGDGKATGQIFFSSGSLFLSSGGVLDFDISELSPGAAVRVNDYSKVWGKDNAQYTLTVSPLLQENGVYALMDKVSSFNYAITVRNTSGESLGTIRTGETFKVGKVQYALALEDSSLTLIVSGNYNIVSGRVINNGENVYATDGYLYYDTTVNDGGSLDVYFGGTANSTTINSGGRAYVGSSGTANSTTVNDGGRVYVGSSGTAISTTVNDGGWIHVSSGGTANSTTVSFGGSLSIQSGGTATDILENGGYVEIGHNANVSFVKHTLSGLVLSSRATVHSGTTAINTTVNSGGWLYIYSTGIADNTTVKFGGIVTVYSAGIANSTTVNSNGWFSVNSGGTADSTTVNSGGRFSVNSGGTANNTTINSGGNLSVSSGGTANSTTVNSGGGLYIYSTGIADYTTVKFGGNITVYSAGIANNTTIDSGGWFYVWAGGTANSTTIDSGGRIYVSSGGTATNFTADSGAVLFIELDSNTRISGTIAGSAFEAKNGVVSNQSFQIGSMFLVNGGAANNITVNSGGWVYVSSGGTTNSTTIDSGGRVYVSSGGLADSTTVNSGGRGYLFDNGLANSTTVNAEGFLEVWSGGIANNTTVNVGGNLYVSFGGTANSTTVSSGGWIHVSSGGTANSTTVNIGGTFFTASGGTATEILENGGYVEIGQDADVSFAKHAFSGLALSMYAATVHSGTTAINTTVDSGGQLYVSSGGLADSTTVNSGGRGYLFDNGLANSTTVNAEGFLEVWSGGIANNTTVNVGGNLSVSSGGTANSTTVNSGGRAYVYNGGSTDSTTVNDGGYAFVSSGGTANSTTINSGGELDVASSGTADSTTVNSGGWINIRSGGIATGITVHDGGYLYVSRGTTVTGFTAESGAFMFLEVDQDTNITGTSAGSAFTVKDGVVSHYAVARGNLTLRSGGTADGTTVNSSGGLIVSDGGFANSTTVNESGRVHIHSGGTADNASVNGNGMIIIWSGGKVGNAAVNSGGSLGVISGATADGTTVNSGGSMSLNNSGTANSTMVNSGGTFYISSGGTATAIRENGGYVGFANDTDTVSFASNSFSGLALSGYAATVHSGTTANSTTVNDGGNLNIYSGGTANSTTVNSGGYLSVRSGGIVNTAVLNFSGSISVSSGGFANDATVNSGGRINVYENGSANGITVNPGLLLVLPGGTATAIRENGGFVNVSSGGVAMFVSNSFSGLVLGSGNRSASVHSGTTAHDVTVNASAIFYIYSGGTATAIRENGGYVSFASDTKVSFVSNSFSGLVLGSGNRSASVHSGTTAHSTTVASRCNLFVSSGGIAIGVDIVSGGSFRVNSGGTATGVSAASGAVLSLTLAQNTFITGESAGSAFALKDCILSNYGIHSGGYLNVLSGGVADNTTVNATGSMHVRSLGTANGITVRENGQLHVSSGGIARNVLLDNGASTYAGDSGTVNGITVNGGSLELHSGGSLTGQIVFNKGTTVSMEEGSCLDFDISALAPGAAARVNDLSIVSGLANADFTITVLAAQACGTYLLAEGASGFDKTITVKNTLGESLGTLTVGQTATFNGTDYTLTVADGSLSVAVKAKEVLPDNVVSGLVIGDGENASVLDGEIYLDTTVDWGTMHVSNGGMANSTTVNGGHLAVSSGGTANSTTVDRGTMHVSNGGTANSTTVNSGALHVFSGGVADSAMVDSGSLYVSSGGTATEINAAATAYLVFDVTPDTYITGTFGGSAFEIKDGSVSGYTVISGLLLIESGGVANDTVVNTGWGDEGDFSGEGLYVRSGGAASNTTVNSDGCFLVSSGGTASNTTVNSDGELFISGGVANGVTVSSGGNLYVSSGGTATKVVWTPGEGYVNIGDGAYVTFADPLSGVYLGSDGKLIAHADSMNSKTIGGHYDSRTWVNGDGDDMYVMSGGTVNSTTIYHGYLCVFSGGVANNTDVLNGGENYSAVNIYSGGTANNTTVSGGGMNVFSGGIANDVKVNDGILRVCSGGFADGAMVVGTDEYDWPFVFISILAGGVAKDVTVGFGGLLSVSGVADNVAVRSEGHLYVSSGGIATDVVWTPCEGYVSIRDGAYVTFAEEYSGVYYGSNGKLVSHADSMYGKTLGNEDEDYGSMYVMSGGVANNTTVNEGLLYVSSGGIADFTILKYNGGLTVSSGGTANNTTVEGIMYVERGGVANNITVQNKGSDEDVNGHLYVSSGGTANGITLESGFLSVSSGGTATNVAWTPCECSVNIEDGAYVTFAEEHSGVYLGSRGTLVSHAATMTSKIIQETWMPDSDDDGDTMHVMSGGTAIGTVVKVRDYDGGGVYVWSGGVASSTTVEYGGMLCVSSGGIATDVVWTPCEGYVSIRDGAYVTFAEEYSGVYYGSNGKLVSHADSMYGKTLGNEDEDYGSMYVMSGGVANNVEVYYSYSWNESLQVWSGGTANNTMVHGADILIRAGGIANDTSLAGYSYNNDGSYFFNSACLTVASGGSANCTTVNSDGHLIIRSGGMVNSTNVCVDGTVRVLSGGVAAFTVLSGGSLHVSSGGTATDIVWNPCEGQITIEDGAYVTFASQCFGVYYGKDGKLLSSAISMERKTLDLGYEMHVMSGGMANSTTVNFGGRMHVSSGGIANDVAVNRNGSLAVFSGGAAQDVVLNSAATLRVYSGGEVNDATVNANGNLILSSGATLNGTTLNGGAELAVFAGLSVNKTIVNSDAAIEVSSGAIANSTTVYGNAYLTVSSGGIADNAKVYAGGTMKVASGATMTGKMNFAAGAVIFVEKGAAVDFDLSLVSAGGKALLTDWSLLQGRPDYTLTINGTHAAGVYTLADGAEDFEGTISVRNTFGESLGVLTVGQTVMYNGKDYTLELDDESLLLTVSESAPDTIAPTVSGIRADITALTNRDVTVTAVFEDNYGVTSNFYRIGQTGQWMAYVDGAIVSENATVYFKATDPTDNESEIAEYTVGNIDKVKPVVSGMAADITAPTRQAVTVTAEFSDDRKLERSLYRIGEDGEWLDYSGGVTVSENTPIYFKAVDAAGNESEAAVYEVTNNEVPSEIISGIVLEEYESAIVSSGQLYTDVTVNGGSITVISGGMVNGAAVNSEGQFRVEPDGLAENISVNRGGSLYVSSGGTATIVDWTPCEGYIYLDEGTHVTFASQYSGVYLGSEGVLVSSAETMRSKKLGDDDWWDEEEDEEVYVACDGTEMRVMSGGIAFETTVTTMGNLYVSSGGSAKYTVLKNGGWFDVEFGGTADDTTVSYGCLRVEAGGIANRTTVSGRIIDDGEGIYRAFGQLSVTSGGTATEVTLRDGILLVESGGVVSGIAGSNSSSYSEEGYYDYGYDEGPSVWRPNPGIHVSAGGKLTGRMTFNARTKAFISNGAVVDFDLTQTSAGTAALLNDFSAIVGAPYYTLTVEAEQASGTYRLADGVSIFYGVISVISTSGTQLGSITVGQTSKIGETEYTLNVSNGSLSVTVNASGAVPADTTKPTVSNVTANITVPTNGSVTVTADFTDNVAVASSLYRIGETGEWLDYKDGVVVTENATVYLKAIDASGNESEIASCTVSNIDRDAPSVPSGLTAVVSDPTVVFVWNSSTDTSGIKEYVMKYSRNGQTFTAVVNNTNYMLSNLASGSWSWSVQAVDLAGNKSGFGVGNSFVISGEDVGSVSDIIPQTQTWEKAGESVQYAVEYSVDNFKHVIRFAADSNSLDSFRMPSGIYQWRVKPEGGSEWTVGEPVMAAETNPEPKHIISDANGNADVFFANSIGTWKASYVAQHVGSTADTWGGTKEYASLYSKNKLADIIEGSTDANILLMTDDDNGDALFVDDIYTALPGSVSEQQSRIAQIDEIRAGAGADIVDMTSQRFEYVGDGLTIRGGEGNDTIWANKGDNRLFGDAGNDRIVGASGNDVIAGGIGNDRMHGGGGDDIFTFCDNWGSDNVEQLAGGSVTLWFASGMMENWDKTTLTYTDGDNSVKVSGVTADKITLIFGDDGSDQFATLSGMGAFFDATTECIFEESGKGILASL